MILRRFVIHWTSWM